MFLLGFTVYPPSKVNLVTIRSIVSLALCLDKTFRSVAQPRHVSVDWEHATICINPWSDSERYDRAEVRQTPYCVALRIGDGSIPGSGTLHTALYSWR